jgi:hypothetical protein
MAGILDSKERIIDLVVTPEGRRQMNGGRFVMEYATLTDVGSFYSGDPQPDGSEVADDAGARIHFEAVTRYQDVVVPELEDGIVMRPLRTSDVTLSGRSFLSGSSHDAALTYQNVLTGSALLEESERALRGIGTNFRDLRVLATEDPFSDNEGFRVTPNEIEFNRGSTWNRAGESGILDLEEAPSVFADKHFTHLPNFQYLPPVNVARDTEGNAIPLADYPSFLPPNASYGWAEIQRDLIGRQSSTVGFPNTSRDNNLMGQAFEVGPSGVEKLTVVDFGEFDDDDISTRPSRVFFVGKMLRDASGTETFVKIFTLIAE